MHQKSLRSVKLPGELKNPQKNYQKIAKILPKAIRNNEHNDPNGARFARPIWFVVFCISANFWSTFGKLSANFGQFSGSLTWQFHGAKRLFKGPNGPLGPLGPQTNRLVKCDQGGSIGWAP